MALKTFTSLAAYTAAKATLTAADTVSVVDNTLTADQVATLGADTLVDTIRVTPLKLTVSQFNAANAKLQNADNIVVIDTTANIQAGLTALLANSKVDAINSSQDGVGIKITVAQALVAANMVKLQAADTLVVVDTTAAIQTNLSALLANTKIDAINSSQDGQAIKLSAAQANVAANMVKLQAADTLTVVDTTANIQTSLNALLNNSKIDSINSNQDGVAIKLTAAQSLVAANMTKLQTADTLVVNDTPANIQANLTALLANTKIDSIQSNDSVTAITLSIAQAALPKLQELTKIAIVDTTANIQANLATLLADTKVDSINSSQNTVAITLTAAQATDTAVMAKLQATDKITVVITADDTLTTEQAAALHADPKIDKVTNAFAVAADTDVVLEGQAVTFTVTRIDPTVAETLTFNVKGDTSGGAIDAATTGTDFSPVSGTVTFAAGALTATFAVNATSDTTLEGFEGLSVSLFSGITKVLTSDAVFISDDPDAPVAGETFTLTTGANTGSLFTGGTGDDFFDGALNSNDTQTLGTSDSLNGGGGDDTLSATITGSVTPLAITDIETLDIAFTTNTATLNLSNATGVTSISNVGSTSIGTVSNIANLTTALSVQDTSVNSVFSFKTATVAGASDSATVTVNNVTGNADLTIAGVETLNVVSSGSANTMELVAAAATTLNISGDAALDLDISTLFAQGSTSVTKVDASTFTAALSIDTGALGSASAQLTVLGGSGNDTIDIDAVAEKVSVSGGAGNDTVVAADAGADITVDDIIAGGDGTDTLSIAAALTVGTATGISGFETLTLTATATDQDMDAFSAATFTRVNTTVTADTTIVTFTDVSSNVTTLGISGAAPDDVNFTRKLDTTSDSLTIEFTGAGTTFDAGDGVLSVANEETLTISSGGSAANTIDTLTATDLTSLTVTGAQNLTITEAMAATGIATINSSTATGTFSINASNSAVDLTGITGINNTTIISGSGNDTLTGGAGNDSLNVGSGTSNSASGGAGDDSLDGGTGKDTLNAGAGNDTLDASSGIDSLSGGDGNDTFQFDTDGDLVTTSGSADTIDGGAGNDTLTLTTSTAFSTAPTLTSIEIIDATITGAVALDLSGAASVTTVNVKDGSAAGVSITNLVSGATVAIYDANASVDIDTAAGANLTIDSRLTTTGTGVTVTDAASVTLTSTATTNDGDLVSVTLDAVDTTTLTITGSTDADADVDTGAIDGTDKLATISASTSTTGAAVIVDTIVDADSLTSLTVAANNGNINFGAIGGTGTAEALSTLTVTADNGATATLGGVTADTTDSTTDNAMTLTATAGISSTVTLATITNTYGTITGVFSGTGTAVNSTSLVADDVTLTVSAAGTHGGVTATDDITITASNAAALTFSALTAGTASTGAITVTASGSAAFEISDVNASAGALSVVGSTASGTVKVVATDWTGASTLTGGSANDTLTGGSGNDTITGNAGDDSLTAGGGNDTLMGGDGNDTLVLGGTGTDSLDGGDGNDTFTVTTATDLTSADTLSGGAGNDILNITIATATIAPTASLIETANATFSSASGGAFNGGNVTGLTELVADVTGDVDTVATLVTLASGSTVTFGGATAANNNDFDSVTVDTVATGTLTINLNEDQATANANDGDITISDAASVTIKQGTRALSIWDDIALDSTDTTSLAFVGQNSLALTVGDVTSSDALASLSVTSAASSAVVMGSMVDADSLTSLTLTGTTGNVTVGVIGTAGASGNAETLATVSISATGGSTVDIDDIQADDVDSATDLAMNISLSAEAGSTITTGDIVNTFGSIAATLSGAGTIKFGGSGANDSTETISVASATINASAATGTNAIVLTTVTGTAAVTLASTAADDTIVVGTGGLVSITNFEKGASGDIIAFDLSDIGIPVGGDGADETTATATLLDEATGADTVAAAENIVVLTGNIFATKALAEAAIEDGGTYELTLATANTANDDLLVAWSDGSSTYIGAYNITSTTANPLVGDLTVLVELVGVNASVAGTLVSANFDFV
ncbi:MAG: hypothetical protein QX199_19915 [Methylococcaceae bacterium]